MKEKYDIRTSGDSVRVPYGQLRPFFIPRLLKEILDMKLEKAAPKQDVRQESKPLQSNDSKEKSFNSAGIRILTQDEMNSVTGAVSARARR